LISERRRARRAALQVLFEVNQASHDPSGALETRITEENGLSESSAAFVRSLVSGVLSHKQRIDEIIVGAAPAWPIEQVAVTDRVALEIGVYEICVGDGTPVEVAINEAVELAKIFGGENSAGFVNGVLRTIAERSAVHSCA